MSHPNSETQNMDDPAEIRREYQYFTDFVKQFSENSNLDISKSLLFAAGSGFRLNEIVLSKPHDKDAIDMVAADLVFFIFHAAGNEMTNIKGIIRCNTSNDMKGKASNLSTALKELLFAHATNPNLDLIDIKRIEGLNCEILGRILEITEKKSIHRLFAICIQLKGGNDDIMLSRFNHIMAKPHMQYQIECNTIFPLYYILPFYSNREFLDLLRKSGVVTMGTFLVLHEVVEKVQIYLINLMKAHNLSWKDTSSKLEKTFGKYSMNIDVKDKNTLIYPIVQNLSLITFEENWNAKFHNKIPYIVENHDELAEKECEEMTIDEGLSVLNKFITNYNTSYSTYEGIKTEEGISLLEQFLTEYDPEKSKV